MTSDSCRRVGSQHWRGEWSTKAQRFPGPREYGIRRTLNTVDRLIPLEDILISAEHRGIQNVVVSLAGVPLAEQDRPAPSRLTLDNTSCRFDPHMAVLTTGSILEATNSDRFFHSVHVYGLFNLNVGLGPGQSKVVRTLSRPGRYVVRCDVHGWMRAYLWVDDHPYHAVSAEDGSFRIENVPAGSYTLTAWQEVLGNQEVQVAFRAGEVSRLNLVYDRVLGSVRK